MHTFLIGLNKRNNNISPVLDRACRITKKLLPSLGVELEVRKRLIPEVNAGWFYIVPKGESSTCLITEFVNDDIAILVFGDIFQSKGGNAAEIVFDTWKRGDIETVRSLDGCFSAAIIDYGSRTAYIVSDLLGHRTLRYFSQGESLFISSHDIPIVATGLCPVEIDLVSACSIICFDWSLGGKSLLKGIEVCDPNEYVTWQEGNIRRMYKPLIKPEARIHSKDKASFHRYIDLMIDIMVENTRSFCRDKPVLHMDLTAGLDTRTVLAILLSVIDGSRLKSLTAGSQNSFEVMTARRLAEMYHFDHDYDIPKESNWDSFMDHCRLRAFMLNGDTNGKRAVDSLPSYDETPRISGNGAEIYRGYYYPASYGNGSLLNLTSQGVIRLLEKKIGATEGFPWISSQLLNNVRLRLVNILNAYSEISPFGSDILDLFYVFERYGRWGSMVPRSTWEPRRFSPFNSTALLRLGFKLPPPIANDLVLLKTIIRRLLPNAYYLPINGNTFLPFLGWSFPKPFMSKWISRIIYYSRLFRRFLGPRMNIKTNDQIRAEIFAQVLDDMLGDVLLEEGSVGTRIFEKEGLQRIIDDHVSGKKDNLQVIGHLAIMEAYRNLMAEVSDMVRRMK